MMYRGVGIISEMIAKVPNPHRQPANVVVKVVGGFRTGEGRDDNM